MVLTTCFNFLSGSVVGKPRLCSQVASSPLDCFNFLFGSVVGKLGSVSACALKPFVCFNFLSGSVVGKTVEGKHAKETIFVSISSLDQ